MRNLGLGIVCSIVLSTSGCTDDMGSTTGPDSSAVDPGERKQLLLSVDEGSASITVDPSVVFADGIQTATVTVTDIHDASGDPVADGTPLALGSLHPNGVTPLGRIEGGNPNPSGQGYRTFTVDDKTIVATFRAPNLSLSPGQTLPVSIVLATVLANGSRGVVIATAEVGLVGTSAATISVDPGAVFADGIQTATVRVTDIRDASGNPVPDGTQLALGSFFPNGTTPLGTIEGGDPNPSGQGYRNFTVAGNTIVATFRSPDAPLSANQSFPVSIVLAAVLPNGSRGAVIATAEVGLIGTSAATITVDPYAVFADGIQTATVTVTEIHDASGNPVPDGTQLALGSFFSNGTTPLGTIEGGDPNPSGQGYRTFTVADNTIVATFRGRDLAIAPGQTVPVSIVLAAVLPNGSRGAVIATAEVGLIATSAATITVDPDAVFADGIQTATVTVTEIRDASGNPVPNGTQLALGSFFSNGTTPLGAIEGGDPNPSGQGYRTFTVADNTIVATFRGRDLAIAPNQTVPVSIVLASLLPDERSGTVVATAGVVLVGTSAATITVNPEDLFADGIQTATVTVTDIRDASGDPVPDGTQLALGSSFSSGTTLFGAIEGGDPNPSGQGYRTFTVVDNTIVATFRAPDLTIAPGQILLVSVVLATVLPDGRRGAVVTSTQVRLTGNQPPTADAAGPYSGQEGTTLALDGSGSLDPDGDPLVFEWDFGDGHTATGPSPNHVYRDEGVYEITLVVTDANGLSDAATTIASVSNAPPAVVAISAPSDPQRIDSFVVITAPFTDPGVLDTHTASVDWGDGTVTEATITESDGSGSLSASRAYEAPGVYTLTTTLRDNGGLTSVTSFEFIVVFDPDGGFVTGGGWIPSPQGAHFQNPGATGKATFGFFSRYEKGASAPTGQTEFQFKAGNLDFHSSSYDWLVVNQGGVNAQYKGWGTVNGELSPSGGPYGFMLWASDTSPDTFRIKIWYEDLIEQGVYDNGFDQAIGGGSIVIHQ